jgi:glycosyltransferase involved in cell wall biosynthesis
VTAGNPPLPPTAKAPVRVLFISPQPFFQWRGSPIRVGFNLQALADLGYEVDLLTYPFGEPKEYPGVRIFRIPNFLGLRDMPIGPSLWKLLYDIPLFFKALALVTRRRYTVIHAIEEAGAMGVLLSRLGRTRLIFEKHSDPNSYRRGWLRNVIMSLYARVEAFTIRRADAVIATGTGLIEQVLRVDPSRPTHHIFDIPSSQVEADPARVESLRGELRRHPDEVVVMYVGSFEIYQGIDLLFASIPLVVNWHPNARFVIIGGSPSQIQARQVEMDEAGAGASVTFVGKIRPDDLPHYLTAADILLSPRKAGINTPLKLLDYLKAGRAIVATDNEANRRILDASSALLVEPAPEPFAEGIGRLIRDEPLRQKLGARGHGLIRRRYNFNVYRDRLRHCYNGVLGSGLGAWLALHPDCSSTLRAISDLL